MRYFVIGDDGQKYGPADVATLNSWITEGRLLATTLLENEATGERVAAQATPGLAFAAVGIPTPIAPGGQRQGDQPGGYVAYPRIGIPGAGPQEVPKGFNWGAFYFGWIWGLNHRKPILLLMLPISIVLGFIPILGVLISLGIQIWVGFQGNQWAWDSGRFNTIAQMEECENVWKKWAIAMFALSIVFITLAIVLPLMVAGGRTTR
jgi:hypothetical protein